MAEPLKNQFLTPESLATFATRIVHVRPNFDKDSFLQNVRSGDWEELELKARMRRTTEWLHKILSLEYPEAITLLAEIAPDIKGMEAMCLPDYVELYGMDDWDRSLPAMRHFTRFSSSEFAIRPYLIADLERAMAFMQECSTDEHENVRRFSSEGCRPRLPWAMAIPALQHDPHLILPILDRLKTDPSEFVRRSVSNNLNDISKDHPEPVLDLAEQWVGNYGADTDKLVKHALRTLLKKGNTRAMRLFGFGDPAKIQIRNFSLGQDTIKIGDNGHFAFELLVETDQQVKVRLEYAVDYVKANGKTSRKVFQILENDYQPGNSTIERKYTFQDMTTRKHYPGKHVFTILVNGIEKATASVEVVR